MKTLLSAVIALLCLSACKKDKDAPVPTTVVSESIGLQYDTDQGIKTVNWFSLDKMQGLSMPDIAMESSLQKNILFGYYNNGNDYGLYSPEVFPVVYGQENWLKKRAVVFRKSPLSVKDMQELLEKNGSNLSVEAILHEWNKGVNQSSSITHPHEGETYMFRTTDQQITGMFTISNVSLTFTTLFAEIWIAK